MSVQNPPKTKENTVTKLPTLLIDSLTNKEREAWLVALEEIPWLTFRNDLEVRIVNTDGALVNYSVRKVKTKLTDLYIRLSIFNSISEPKLLWHIEVYKTGTTYYFKPLDHEAMMLKTYELINTLHPPED
jgi:hypothetical protein